MTLENRLMILQQGIQKTAARLDRVLKSNTCHVPSGPKGGQFCETGGGGRGRSSGGAPTTFPVSAKPYKVQVGGESAAVVTSTSALDSWARSQGFGGAKDFSRRTGSSFQQVKGKPFRVLEKPQTSRLGISGGGIHQKVEFAQLRRGKYNWPVRNEDSMWEPSRAYSRGSMPTSATSRTSRSLTSTTL